MSVLRQDSRTGGRDATAARPAAHPAGLPAAMAVPLPTVLAGLILLALCGGLLPGHGRPAQAAAYEGALVTDLSNHLISITSSFSGTSLLLFGAISEPGDVVVIVRGPSDRVMVRRKERTLGVWMNRSAAELEDVPGYYAVSTTRPRSEFASPDLLRRLQAGPDFLEMPVARENDADPAQAVDFRDALIRIRAQQGLFNLDESGVVFVGQRLFRAPIAFPATVPVGTYRAEVYLIRDDRVVAAQATPLFVMKRGLEQTLFQFAQEQRLAYGILIVLIAIFVGWALSTLLQSRR
ncbi:MAG: TIGR02186 family protein [Sneathiellaceae bacterium]